MRILKVKYTELNFLTLQQFRLPNGLPACLPAVRPGSTMARAPVFSHDTCIIGGFTNLLFRRRFAYCAMLHLFILPPFCFFFNIAHRRREMV